MLNPMRKDEAGFSLIELLIVVAIILVIAAIAIPNLLRARISANQAAAAATLRNLNSSQVTYFNEFPGTGFAVTLAQLGPSVACDQAGACLADELLGCKSEPCKKGGYEYYLAAGSATIPQVDYSASATPTGWGTSGTRNFCSTEDFVVRQEVAPAGKVTAAVPHKTCADPAQFAALSN